MQLRVLVQAQRDRCSKDKSLWHIQTVEKFSGTVKGNKEIDSIFKLDKELKIKPVPELCESSHTPFPTHTECCSVCVWARAPVLL